MADGTPCVPPSGSPRAGPPRVPPQEEGAAAAVEPLDDLSSPCSVSGSSAGTSRDNSAEREPPGVAKPAPAAGIMKMIQTSRTLIESADAVHAKIIQVQQAGMGFHKELHRLEAKEGLKGRKLQKALESFAWNITVLKGQADLLKHSKAEALDILWQIHNAAQSCGIGRNGAASPDLFRNRAVLDPIPEAEGACEPGSS